MERRTLGMAGEEIATVYLKRKGYRILARNRVVRGKRQLGELDIVAQKGGEVIFVEVKAGTGVLRAGKEGGVNSAVGPFAPEMHVTAMKAQRLRRAARAWLGAHGRLGSPVRIDVIAVDFGGDLPCVRHFRNAVSGDT